jgi:hypothetical protein
MLNNNERRRKKYPRQKKRKKHFQFFFYELLQHLSFPIVYYLHRYYQAYYGIVK